MKAIILAAGYATRLYPLTIDRPKALLVIKEKAMIEYIVRKLQEIGDIDEVFIITNNKFYKIVSKWVEDNKKEFRPEIRVVNDLTNSNEERLGGIGDLWFCIENSSINPEQKVNSFSSVSPKLSNKTESFGDEDILVLNSDNLFDFSLKEAFDFFQIKKGIVNGVYLVDNKEVAKKHGVVELLNDKIVSFEEKPNEPKTCFTSIGVYFFPKQVLPMIKKYLDSGNTPDAPGNLIKYFCEHFNVYGYLFKGKLFDVGNLESYNEANKSWDG